VQPYGWVSGIRVALDGINVQSRRTAASADGERCADQQGRAQYPPVGQCHLEFGAFDLGGVLGRRRLLRQGRKEKNCY
jgi:hypothetical protein